MVSVREKVEALTIGQKAGEIELRITDEMVDTYAEAVGDFDPLFAEKDSNGQRIAHPELLPKCAMGTLWSPILKQVPGIRAKQSYEFLRPVKTGVTYSAAGYLVDRYEKRGRLYVVFEATFTDPNGEPVLKDRRTQLILTETETIKN